MASALPKQDIISFGFLESNVEDNEILFNEQFDVVLKGGESFEGIQKMLKLK